MKPSLEGLKNVNCLTWDRMNLRLSEKSWLQLGMWEHPGNIWDGERTQDLSFHVQCFYSYLNMKSCIQPRLGLDSKSFRLVHLLGAGKTDCNHRTYLDLHILYEYVWMWVGVHVCAHTHTRGGQKSVLSVIPQDPDHLVLRQGLCSCFSTTYIKHS